MKTILVVDDEFGVAETLAELLTLDGYTALRAWNGQLALEIVRKQAVDLILLDVMMPIMSGRQVLRALKDSAEWRSIPVVMMSAAATLSSAELTECAGFLSKPFDFGVLMRLIQEIVG